MRSTVGNTVALVVVVVGLAVGGPWFVAQLRTLPKAGALAARSDQRIVTLEISGMTCAGCSAKIQSSLAALPGVTTAEVRLKQDRAYVVCEKAVADSTLLGAVGRAGPGYLAAIVTK